MTLIGFLPCLSLCVLVVLIALIPLFPPLFGFGVISTPPIPVILEPNSFIPSHPPLTSLVGFIVSPKHESIGSYLELSKPPFFGVDNSSSKV